MQLERVFHLLLRLGQMDVDADANAGRHRSRARQKARLAHVRRMRAEDGADPAVGRSLPALHEIDRSLQVGADVVLLAENAPRQQRAQPGRFNRIGDKIHVEVVVGERHCAAADHFGHRQQRAPVNILIGQLRLDHPDPLVEPAVQRQVLRPAALKGHRRVRMCVDKSGHQHMVGSVYRLVRLKASRRAADRHDALAIDRNFSVAQDRASRVQRDDVGMLDECLRHVQTFRSESGHPRQQFLYQPQEDRQKQRSRKTAYSAGLPWPGRQIANGLLAGPQRAE